jgi:hypothetical protein
MSNFLIRTQLTTGEWLRLSISWTVACSLVCVIFNLLLNRLFPTLSAATSSNALLLSAAVAHCLIWWQAVFGGDAIIQREERQQAFTWTRLAANVWLVGLTVFQLLSLFGLLLLALFRNSTGADIGSFLG